MSTLSHCPSWCDGPAGHGPYHSAKLTEYTSESNATIEVLVTSYANGRPDVQLTVTRTSGPRAGYHGCITLDAEKAHTLANILDAAGLSDVARGLFEACMVIEDAS